MNSETYIRFRDFYIEKYVNTHCFNRDPWYRGLVENDIQRTYQIHMGFLTELGEDKLNE